MSLKILPVSAGLIRLREAKASLFCFKRRYMRACIFNNEKCRAFTRVIFKIFTIHSNGSFGISCFFVNLNI